MMAPAHGLFLEEVLYPPELQDPGFDPTPPEPPPGAAGGGPASAEGDQA
jgi:hypothetical protein